MRRPYITCAHMSGLEYVSSHWSNPDVTLRMGDGGAASVPDPAGRERTRFEGAWLRR